MSHDDYVRAAKQIKDQFTALSTLTYFEYRMFVGIRENFVLFFSNSSNGFDVGWFRQACDPGNYDKLRLVNEI